MQRTGGTATGSNLGPHMEVAKPAIFNREVGKVGRFITVCRLFLRMKLREAMVEEQVQWVFLYIQGCMEGECNGGIGVRGGRI